MRTSEVFLHSPETQAVLRVLDFGATKHGDFNYLQRPVGHHLKKAIGHAIKARAGGFDEETNESHWAHVVARVWFAYRCAINGNPWSA